MASVDEMLLELDALDAQDTTPQALLQRLDDVESVQEPTEPGFFSRVGARLSERGEQLQEVTAAPPETTVESLEKGLQVLGTGAGAALDVGGEAISSGFDLLSQGLSAITPDAIEDPIVSKVGDAFESIVGTDIAQAGLQAASEGIEAYRIWEEENPRAAKNVAALANIALVAAPVKVKPKGVLKPTPVGRAGEAVAAVATKQVADRRTEFVEGLIRPKPTPKVREAEIQRTSEGGLFQPREVTLSPREKNIATAVADIPGVTSKNTLLQNLNAVQVANKAEAENLRGLLKSSTNKVPRPEIKTAMDDVTTRLGDNPLLVGDAAKTGERIVARARSFMENNPNTPAGVFKARQQFDEWVKTQKPKIFDPNTESALSIAVRETRQSMNDIVAKNAPDVDVRASLSKQSSMFDALDNIGAKAADEGATAVTRLAQRVAKATGIKGKLTQTLTALGAVGVAGATSPTMLGAAATIAGLGYASGKFILSPKTKRGIAQLLKHSETAIQKSKGSPEVLKKLRADRAAVIEVLKNSTTTED